MPNNTCRILAEGQLRSNNTWATGLNNNDLIIGPSGAGKTRNYVKPNLMETDDSVIVADTKGSLISEVGPMMEARGFRVVNIDFNDMGGSYGYNPLDYVRRDPKTGKWSEQDIMSIATALVPIDDPRQPFWELAARTYLACILGYVLECLPQEEHTLEYAGRLVGELNSGSFDKLLEELGQENPDSFAYKKYRLFAGNKTAEKMHQSIIGILGQKMDPLTWDGPVRMYAKPDKVSFPDLGRERTAVFLTVSDTDRSNDRLAALFYTQALQALCASADKDYPDHRLPVPVRLILDDFATNVRIEDFDQVISVIRSREIYVSVIIQSLSQLEALYGHAKAATIMNNCDNCLYLGGQDVGTARYIAVKANRTADTILNMALDDAYLFTRGQPPRKVRKYDLRSHARYADLPEAAGPSPAPGGPGKPGFAPAGAYRERAAEKLQR